MRKKVAFSESDVAPLVKRYSPSILLTLLREIAKCETAKLDWDALIKSSTTGITSAREYQALWRSLAYRAELGQCSDDDTQPLDDESDLELELEAVPAVSSETAGEVSLCVKQQIPPVVSARKLPQQAGSQYSPGYYGADMQRHGITGVALKRKADQISKSKSKDGDLAAAVIHVPALSGTSNGGGTLAGTTSAKGVPTPTNGLAAWNATGNSQSGNSAPTSANANALLAGVLSQTDRKKRRLWTPEEDLELIAAVEKCGEGNWTNILKCGFNYERTASQLSQRWALIRKRREVQEKAGFRVAPGFAPSAPGTIQAQTVASSSVPATVSSPSGVGQTVAGSSTGSASPGPVQSTGMPLGYVGAPPVIPPSVAVVPPTGTGNPQGQGPEPVALYAVSSSAGHVGSIGVGDTHRVRGATGNGGPPSRTANGLRQQAQNQGSMRANGASVTATGTGQGRSTGTVVSGSTGGTRLLAPGAMVMSAAAAQAASVGGTEMWHTVPMPSTTAGITSTGGKYVPRNSTGANGARGGHKGLHGPDPMVQAAAVAAGARIAPASAAASLLMAAQSGNVVHIGPGGVPMTKVGHSNQAGMGVQPLNSVSARGQGAIVHYIRTGAGAVPQNITPQRLPLQHTSKNQPGRASGNGASKSSPLVVPVALTQASSSNSHMPAAPNQLSKSNGASRSGPRSHSNSPSSSNDGHRTAGLETQKTQLQPSNDVDNPAASSVRRQSVSTTPPIATGTSKSGAPVVSTCTTGAGDSSQKESHSGRCCISAVQYNKAAHNKRAPANIGLPLTSPVTCVTGAISSPPSIPNGSSPGCPSGADTGTKEKTSPLSSSLAVSQGPKQHSESPVEKLSDRNQ